MAACVRETGAPVVDLRREFNDEKDYWPGDWHFTPEGTEKLAQVLAERIRQAIPAAFGSG
jgi:hypothetical protein